MNAGVVAGIPKDLGAVVALMVVLGSRAVEILPIPISIIHGSRVSRLANVLKHRFR